MITSATIEINGVQDFLRTFVLEEKQDLFSQKQEVAGRTEYFTIGSGGVPKYSNEFWTSKQRQASSLHEIAYRACFKPQLPRFFINLLSTQDDIIYDPFSGRGTTAIEGALLGRNVIANDANPLSNILTKPRLAIPKFQDVEARLNKIPWKRKSARIDLSMFYHPQTEFEIVSLRDYLYEQKQQGAEDQIDAWIRMVATNRLTGHSSGFFSVYTLPPNQAVSPESQIKINKKLGQSPEYRDTKKIILKKTSELISDIDENVRKLLNRIGRRAQFLTEDARNTKGIEKNSVQLTVTSPPFLDIVQYSGDNWLRCWFNNIDDKIIAQKITMVQNLEQWCDIMQSVFEELHRITQLGGWVAFEVGEIRKGKIRLDEHIVPLGINAGFKCEAIVINEQRFTKTSNIWGINNNERGTNSNRIVLFQKTSENLK